MRSLQNSNYISECTQLLQAFEISQAEMLQKNYQTAAGEFAQELEEMKVLFGQALGHFENQPEREKAKNLLLIKQIERLLKFMKEFSLHINDIFRQDKIEDKQIIFIFERQHKFKQIYRRHIEDYRKIA
jgi:hypothetical protein